MLAREDHGRENSVVPVLVALVIEWLDYGADAGLRSGGRKGGKDLHEAFPIVQELASAPLLPFSNDPLTSLHLLSFSKSDNNSIARPLK